MLQFLYTNDWMNNNDVDKFCKSSSWSFSLIKISKYIDLFLLPCCDISIKCRRMTLLMQLLFRATCWVNGQSRAIGSAVRLVLAAVVVTSHDQTGCCDWRYYRRHRYIAPIAYCHYLFVHCL